MPGFPGARQITGVDLVKVNLGGLQALQDIGQVYLAALGRRRFGPADDFARDVAESFIMPDQKEPHRRSLLREQ
jgi:hypothetical protein